MVLRIVSGVVAASLLSHATAVNVAFEGLDMNKEEEEIFAKEARQTQEAMRDLVRSSKKAREAFECNACVATAREILPKIEQTKIDMKGMARSWDLLASMEEVCEDDGPQYGIQIFQFQDKVDGVKQYKAVPAKQMRLHKQGSKDGMMRGAWIVEKVNEVCSVVVNDHYEIVGQQDSLRDIVREACVEGTNYCKRQDYLRFLEGDELGDIDAEAAPSLKELLSNIAYKQEATMKDLRCNACQAVSKQLQANMNAFHRKQKKKGTKTKETESEYLQALEGWCAPRVYDSWGFQYDWLTKSAKPNFVKPEGIKIPSEQSTKILARTCDDVVNDHYEVFLPWDTTRGTGKKKRRASHFVCPSFCGKAPTTQKDEL